MSGVLLSCSRKSRGLQNSKTPDPLSAEAQATEPFPRQCNGKTAPQRKGKFTLVLPTLGKMGESSLACASGLYCAGRIDTAQRFFTDSHAGLAPRDGLLDRLERLLRSRHAPLGHAEVDHLDHRAAVVQGDQYVAGLDIAMDSPFLVGMLYRVANRREQVQSLSGRQVVLVAVVR